MNYDEWKEHLDARLDCTNYITHLTKRHNDKSALDVLFSIIDNKKIKGSGNLIINKTPVVCFQEIPLKAMALNIRFEEEKDWSNRVSLTNDSGVDITEFPINYRYEAFGIMLDKCYAYKKGVRPVFYGEKEELFDIVSEKEYWRIVSLNLSNPNNLVDWMHEREWRYKGDFDFEYNDVSIIVGSELSKQKCIDYYRNRDDVLSQIKEIIVLKDYLTDN